MIGTACFTPPHVPDVSCSGTGFTVAAPSPLLAKSVSFQAVATTLLQGKRALSFAHPSVMHDAIPCLTPLDRLAPEQLERLEFVYVTTIDEVLHGLASVDHTESLPHVILVDAMSLDGSSDLYALVRLLATLDNTVRYVREYCKDSACFSVCTLPLLSQEAEALLRSTVPNPTISVSSSHEVMIRQSSLHSTPPETTVLYSHVIPT